MNPGSRMAVFAALVFAFPAVLTKAVRAGEMSVYLINSSVDYEHWTAVISAEPKAYPSQAKKTYYLYSPSAAKYKFCAQGDQKVFKLYDEPKEGKLSKVTLVRRRDKECVILFAVPSVPAARKPAAKAPGRTWNNAPLPQGVNGQVWSQLQKAFSDQPYPGDIYARVFQCIHDRQPEHFSKIIKESKAGAVLGAIQTMQKIIFQLHDGGWSSAESIYAALTNGGPKSRLNQILDGSGGAPGRLSPAPLFTLPGAPPAVPGGPAGKPQADQSAGSQDCLHLIASKFEQKPSLNEKYNHWSRGGARHRAVTAAGERFARYIMEGTSAGKFVSQEIPAQERKEVKAYLLEWVKDRVGDPAWAGKVAELLCVLGVGGENISLLADSERERVLLEGYVNPVQMRAALDAAMNPWTAPFDGSKRIFPHQLTPSDGFQTWTSKFLLDAMQKAHDIFAANRVKPFKPNVNEDNTPVDAGGKGNGKTLSAADLAKQFGRGFSFESLYRRGAVVNEYFFDPGSGSPQGKASWLTKLFNSGAGSGDKFSRAISLKMVTVKDGDRLTNKIGIIDCTNRSDAFGGEFPIQTSDGKVSVTLREGWPPYELTFKANGDNTDITFGRPGQTNGLMTTTLSELHELRAKQIREENAVMRVGDDNKEFYVLGRGGHRGALCLWPKEEFDANNGMNKPQFVVEVNERRDGQDEMLGPRNIGDVSSGDGEKTTHYNLIYNAEKRYWEAKEGDPIKEESAKENGAKDDKKDDKDNKDEKKDDKDSDSGGGGQGRLCDPHSKLDELAVKDGLTCASSQPGKADIRKIYRFYTKASAKTFNDRYLLIVDTPEYIKAVCSNMYLPAGGLGESGEDSGKAASKAAPGEFDVIGGRFLMVSGSTAARYYDLERLPDGKPIAKCVYPFGGNVGTVQGYVFNVPNKVLLESAMSKAGFSKPEIQTARKNLDALKVDFSSITITGEAGKDNKFVKAFDGQGKMHVIWSKSGKVESEDEADNAPAGVEAPGEMKEFKFPTTVSYKEKTQPDEIVVMDSPPMTKAAALCVNRGGSRWYLWLKYKTEEGQLQRGDPQLVFANGSKDERLGRPNLPTAAIHLAAQPVPGQFGIKMMKDSSQEKGFFYVSGNSAFKSDQQFVDKCANNKGLVLWWGYSRQAEAKAACDKL